MSKLTWEVEYSTNKEVSPSLYVPICRKLRLRQKGRCFGDGQLEGDSMQWCLCSGCRSQQNSLVLLNVSRPKRDFLQSAFFALLKVWPPNELKMRVLGGKGENVRAAESGDSANEIKTALNITTSTSQCSEVEQSIASWVRDKAPLITPWPRRLASTREYSQWGPLLSSQPALQSPPVLKKRIICDGNIKRKYPPTWCFLCSMTLERKDKQRFFTNLTVPN